MKKLYLIYFLLFTLIFYNAASLVQAGVLYEKGFEITAEKKGNPNNCEIKVKIKNRYDNVPNLSFIVNIINSKGVNVIQIPFLIVDIKKNQLYERISPTGIPCFDISKLDIKLM
jgi:hypothetical protein